MTSTASTTASSPGCLSEEDVLAFAGGQLSADARRRAHLHLDACEECQQLLNEAVYALAASRMTEQAPQTEVAWSTTFRPGAQVGRYSIRRFIARGGMGEVYEAFDQELQERVALKTVTSTASDDPGAVRRLKAEVQLARRVSHPNVCRIYDFGTHLDSRATSVSFLTMEFVEGETLGCRLRRGGALPVEQALALARALLGGLSAAHEAGVLHRDFKSENVLIREDGARLEPSILDFGLARAFDSAASQSSSGGHTLVGTLAYMAPEQLEGQPFTPASDIYSFGLVWFEMLTGQLPFKAGSSPAVTTVERLTKPVPAPSSMNPLVPSALDAVVLACLRRHARDRLQTAAQVLERLDAVERLATAPTRRARPALAFGGLGVVVGLVAAALVHGGEQTPRARADAAAPSARGSARISPAVVRLPMPPEPTADAVTRPAPRLTARAEPTARGVEPTSPSKRVPKLLPSASPTTGEGSLAARIGWENPFETPQAKPASVELGAVLNQPLEGRAPAGNTELPEGGR